MHTRMHTHSHACTHHTRMHIQPFHSSLDFVRHNPGEPVPKETFTHSHLSWSTIIPYLVPLSITIHGILPVQFTCWQSFSTIVLPKFSFIYLLAWHPQLHIPYISSPNHCLLFAAYPHTVIYKSTNNHLFINWSILGLSWSRSHLVRVSM